MKKVEVVPHDPRWRDSFQAEAKHIAAALGAHVVAIHHIGSTAIPGVHAKPVIDLLVEVDNIEAIDPRSSGMESIGYEVMGEFGIPGRRYFRKDDRHGTRTHQVHAFQAGSGEVVRHLVFREYMMAHPAEAQRYSELKRKLAEEYPWDMDGYIDGKDGFIQEMDRRAAAWRSAQPADGLRGDPG
jgi:GrpB-like predicted nucleotidyltransferase (UPF0157 family)